MASPTGETVQRPLDPAGVVHAARDRGDRVRGRAARAAGRGVVVQSELVANEPSRARCAANDPRGRRARSQAALQSEAATAAHDLRAMLGPPHQVERAADGRGDGPRDRVPARHRTSAPQADAGLRRASTIIGRRSSPASRCGMVKFLAYGWSARAVDAGAPRPGRGGLAERASTPAGRASLASSASTSTSSGTRADVEIEGDHELQQALRFGLFHVLQAGARAEGRAIPAKGLTGPGYDGHAFWDTETFVLPMLTYTLPTAARDALRWRHATLDQARERARAARARRRRVPVADDRRRGVLGLLAGGHRGVPHQRRHRRRGRRATSARPATTDFERECGLELLVETARLWRSLGHHDASGNFGSTGSPVPTSTARSPTTTSTRTSMAQQNLLDAADASCAHRRSARTAWASTRRRRPRGATPPTAMTIPYDEALGVHQQSEGYTDHAAWDFDATPRTLTRSSCTTPTSTSTASRWSSRPTWCWR